MEVLASVLCGQGVPGRLVPGTSVLRRKHTGHISTEPPVFKVSGVFLSLLYFLPCRAPEKLSSGLGRAETWEKQAQWRTHLQMSGVLAGGRDPSFLLHPDPTPPSGTSVHRGQASGCPERGVLSENVGCHMWGLQRPRDTLGV